MSDHVTGKWAETGEVQCQKGTWIHADSEGEPLGKLQTPGVEPAANQQQEPAAIVVQLAPGPAMAATQQRYITLKKSSLEVFLDLP